MQHYYRYKHTHAHAYRTSAPSLMHVPQCPARKMNNLFTLLSLSFSLNHVCKPKSHQIHTQRATPVQPKIPPNLPLASCVVHTIWTMNIIYVHNLSITNTHLIDRWQPPILLCVRVFNIRWLQDDFHEMFKKKDWNMFF